MVKDRKIKSKKVVLASDHAGFKLKEEVKKFLIKYFLISSLSLKPAWSDARSTFLDFIFLCFTTANVKIKLHIYSIKNYTTIF